MVRSRHFVSYIIAGALAGCMFRAIPLIAAPVDVSGEIVNPNNQVGIGNTANMTGDTIFGWQTGNCGIPVVNNGFTFTIDSGGGNYLYYTGDISGPGGLVLIGAGGGNWLNPVQLGGGVGNSYGGATLVHHGTVQLQKSAGDALRGPVTVGVPTFWTGARVVWAADDQIHDASEVRLIFVPSVDDGKETYLDLNGHTDSISNLTMDAGTAVKTGAGGVLTVASLTVDGASYSNGAYDVDSGFVQGSGYIDVGGVGPPVVTNLPATPLTPVPTDGAVDVDPATFNNILDWADCSKATSYQLYLWLSSESQPAAPTATVGISQYTLSADLLSVTNYKWQVAASNVVGTTTGAVWTFATKARWDVSGEIVNPNNHVGIGNTANMIGDTIFGWQTGNCAIPVTNNGFTFTLDSGGGNALYYTGDVSGPGGFTIAGAGGGNWLNPVQIGGSVGNTYGGTTLVHHGTVQLEKSAGHALRGSITVGNSTFWTGARVVWAAGNQIADEADVTVVFTPSTDNGKDSYLDLAGFSDTIDDFTLDTGTWVQTGVGGVLTVKSLTVGETSYPRGIYRNSLAFIRGTGSIVVTGTELPAMLIMLR